MFDALMHAMPCTPAAAAEGQILFAPAVPQSGMVHKRWGPLLRWRPKSASPRCRPACVSSTSSLAVSYSLQAPCPRWKGQPDSRKRRSPRRAPTAARPAPLIVDPPKLSLLPLPPAVHQLAQAASGAHSQLSSSSRDGVRLGAPLPPGTPIADASVVGDAMLCGDRQPLGVEDTTGLRAKSGPYPSRVPGVPSWSYIHTPARPRTFSSLSNISCSRLYQ